MREILTTPFPTLRLLRKLHANGCATDKVERAGVRDEYDQSRPCARFDSARNRYVQSYAKFGVPTPSVWVVIDDGLVAARIEKLYLDQKPAIRIYETPRRGEIVSLSAPYVRSCSLVDSQGATSYVKNGFFRNKTINLSAARSNS